MRKNWYIWELEWFVSIQWIPIFLQFEMLMSHNCSCRPFYKNALRRLVTCFVSTACRIKSRKKWYFFLQMHVIKYSTGLFLYKEFDCWKPFLCCWCGLYPVTFRLGNMELCWKLWPGLKPTRTTSFLLGHCGQRVLPWDHCIW